MSDKPRRWWIDNSWPGENEVEGPNTKDRVPVIEYRAYEDLLEEIQCLRSVLSEYENDHSHFAQMIRADELAEKRK